MRVDARFDGSAVLLWLVAAIFAAVLAWWATGDEPEAPDTDTSDAGPVFMDIDEAFPPGE